VRGLRIRELPPPITRVHTLFRLRTVVNAVSELNKEKKFAGDEEIAEVLAKRRLSKLRLQKMKDRIQRRARDHLKTLIHMGLLTRETKRPYNYLATPSGLILSKYRFVDECPKDPLEKSVFIDRIMRLKLTNAYDMQYSRRYKDFRTRPVLYILTLLTYRPLHLFEIAIALSEKNCDPFLNPSIAEKYAETFARYRPYKDSTVKRIQSDYSITRDNSNSMRRDAGPLLDWSEQLGLVRVQQDWYDITELGKTVEDRYSRLPPVWYFDLGDAPQVKASLLSLYLVLFRIGMQAPDSFRDQKVATLLTDETCSLLLGEIQEQVGVEIFNRDFTMLKLEVDFDPYYDIPPDQRSQVFELLNQQLRSLRLKIDTRLLLEADPIFKLQSLIEKAEMPLKDQIALQFQQQIKIQPPAGLVPTPGLFKSPFETVCCILLRLLGFNVDKYQGVLADYCKSPTAKKMAQDNPDMLMENGLTSLVECKSAGEWGAVIKYRKSIGGEIRNYQEYASDVQANSAMIICEGSFDDEFVSTISYLLDKEAPRILLATQARITGCLNYPSLREDLRTKIVDPVKFPSRERILT